MNVVTTRPPPAPPASGRGNLAERLRARILSGGPIGVDEYMREANAHYYATRDPIGAAGDFTTSPEISQMFGEIVGAALADCWVRAGRPSEAIYAELGPGRGTLAADALRVLRRAGFAGEVHLIETSPALRRAQARRVAEAQWHGRIEDLPNVPLLLVANEFLDALAVRQWVSEEGRWSERTITVVGDRLGFSGAPGAAIREDSPEREAACAAVGAHLAAHGGAALLIDYGHGLTGEGDTLQAVLRHGFADPLANPGEQDLTAHVDFEAAARAATAAGASATALADQGEWLERLGIADRAAGLAIKNPERADEIEVARRRLCSPGEMGQLFKLLGLTAPGWPVPAGFAQ